MIQIVRRDGLISKIKYEASSSLFIAVVTGLGGHWTIDVEAPGLISAAAVVTKKQSMILAQCGHLQI